MVITAQKPGGFSMYGFDGIFHTEIMKSLINNVNNSNINHAYIFEGSEGLGKKNAARLFACAAVCRSARSAPCGICPCCIQAKASSSPDIKIINTGDKKSIGVDKIKDEIVKDVIVKPFSAERKVYIIEDAHLMTEPAQNAFLKVLEEPPAYALFILTVSDLPLILNTIISRCTIVRFPPLPEDQIKTYIKEKYPDDSNDARIDFIAKYSGGIPKNADDIIADPDLEIIRQRLAENTRLLFSKNKLDSFRIADFFEEYKSRASDIMLIWQQMLRDIMLLQENSDIIINADMRGQLENFALYTDEKKIIYALSRLTLSIKMLTKYVNLRAVVLNFTLSVKRFE